MKSLLLFSLILSSVLSAADTKPNIIFFLVDDLGQRDLGCYGSTFYDTPNLDKLAKEGALFTDGYAACPVCSPTRASIQTGKYPQRTGITDYIGAPLKPDQWKRNTLLLPAPYSDRLAHNEVTLAESLKAGGYATFFGGKWHLGPEGWWPEDQGYDVNKGGVDRGGPYGGGRYFSPYGNPRLEDGPPGEHLPDRLAEETNKFMEANLDRPFFAYFSFYSVHTPLMARKDLEAKYEARRKERGLSAAWGREGERDVRLVQEHAVYGGMVEAMDAAVGKVLAKLDSLGLREKTIIIFTSDNGGLSTSEGSPTSNLPLRGGKGWLYEGGIREPLLIRWPGVTKPGSVISEPVICTDLFPTLLAAADQALPANHPSDGINLRPLLEKSEAPAKRTLYWHYPHYGNQGGAPGTAVRRGDWKLIHWFENDRYELFNLAKDLSEKNDLSAAHPDVVDELKKEMRRLHAETGSLDPTVNPNYDPAKPSGRAAGNAAKGNQKNAKKAAKK
jgi:arylsulfatase A-like enzyme